MQIFFEHSLENYLTKIRTQVTKTFLYKIIIFHVAVPRFLDHLSIFV